MVMLGPNKYEAQEDSVAHILFPRKIKIYNRQYKNWGLQVLYERLKYVNGGIIATL